MSLVNIKEVHLVPQEQIHQSVKAFRRQQWLFKVLDEQHSDVLQKKIFSYFNISCFFPLPQVPSQHRPKHFSFQDSQEPPPSVSISSQPQAKVIFF